MKTYQYRNYTEYLKTQTKTSRGKKGYIKTEKHILELSHIVGHFASRYYNQNRKIKILCVGARNNSEAIALRLTFPLADLDITMIDIIGEPSKLLANIYRLLGKEPVIYGDMNAMQYPDETFDMVFSSHSFEHTNKPEVAAQEMKRVTKAGGLIYVCVPSEFDAPAEKSDCTLYESINELKVLFGLKALMMYEQKADSYWMPEYRILMERSITPVETEGMW